jgi:hypothetical protein
MAAMADAAAAAAVMAAAHANAVGVAGNRNRGGLQAPRGNTCNLKKGGAGWWQPRQHAHQLLTNF